MMASITNKTALLMENPARRRTRHGSPNDLQALIVAHKLKGQSWSW
jgi:hypothetical protein